MKLAKEVIQLLDVYSLQEKKVKKKQREKTFHSREIVGGEDPSAASAVGMDRWLGI